MDAYRGRPLLQRQWQRYAFAAISAGAAICLRLFLGDHVHGLPFAGLFPAVLLATLVGGSGPGLFCLALGGLGAWYLLIPPLGRASLPSEAEFWGVLLYLVTALACWWVARILQRSSDANLRMAEERQQLLGQVQDTLNQLAVSEARYRTIGDAIEYGVWVTDAEGMLVHCSQSLLDLTGMTALEAQGMGWTKALHPEDVRATIAAWKRSRETGELWSREHRVRDADGEYHPVLTRGRALRNSDGRITAWVGLNLDIAEMKHTEQALREATRAKNRLLAAAGHDLKQPLQVILGALDRLRTGLSESATEDQLRRAERAVDRLDAALDSLLAASRLELGGVQPVIETFPMQRITGMLADIYAENARSKGLELRVVDCSVTVRTDPDLLATILGNLIGNAIKYTSSGKVLVGCRHRGTVLSIEVIDTGMGIPEALVERIFEEFQQVDRRHEGFGLGLSIVKRTTDLLGLRVKVFSMVGRGSRFTVEVPVALI